MPRNPVVLIVALASLWMATTASSCFEDLKNASAGFNPRTAKCSDLTDFAKADEFDRALAETADRSDQTLDKTTSDAGASREKHCAASANPSYEPYGDVRVDLMK